MKKLIAFILIVLLLVSTVFAAANLDRATTKKITSLIDETETNIKESNTIEENSKKQDIIDAKPDTRDFQIFEDPVIFQEFVQFNDYATMFQTYMQALYVDYVEADYVSAEDLNVDGELYAEEIQAEDIYADDIEVDNIEIEEAYIQDELYLDGNLEVNEEVVLNDLSQTYGEEYAYVCVDADGMIFRSDIACEDLNSGSQNVLLTFENLPETQEITFEGQEFEIKLTTVEGNDAFFNINNDYDVVELGDEIAIGTLLFELEEINYGNQGFESLVISLEGVTPVGPIMVVQSFPVEHTFYRIYENFLFDPPSSIPYQDIEIIGANSNDNKLLVQVNSQFDVVDEGEIVDIDGVEMEFTEISFDGDDFEYADLIVYSVDPGNSSDPLYPEHFITDGEFNGLFVIGATAPANDVVTLVDISADMNNYASVPADSVVLDTEVSSISEQNIITVGTACDNSVIYDLYGNPIDCNYYEQQGIGILKAFETDDDIYALTVDGYGFAERQAAKNVLLNWGDYEDVYDLREQTICVQISTNNVKTSSTRDYIVFEC